MYILKNILKSIPKNTTISVAKVISGNFATTIVTGVAGILVARWTLPYDMGLWQGAVLVTVYVSVLQLGVFNGLNRQLPYLLGTGNSAKALVIAQAAYAWVFVLILFTLLLTGGISLWFFLNDQNNISYAILAVGIIISCTWATLYLSTTYRTHSEFGRLAKNTTFAAIIGLGLTMLVLWLGYIGILLRASLVAIAGVAVLYFRRPIQVGPLWNKELLVQLARVGFPIWFLGQLDTLLFSLDRLVLAKSPRLLGYFTISILVGGVVKNITVAFSAVLYPQMAHKYGETHNAMSIWYIAQKGAFAACLLGLGVGAISWLCLPKFVEVLLPKYIPGVATAQWASFLGFTTGLYVLGNVYSIIGRQWVYFWGWLFGVAVFGGMWFLLVHVSGKSEIIAAAQSMLISTAVMSLIIYWTSRKVCLEHDEVSVGNGAIKSF